jgi:acyl carrier protein
MMGTSIEALLMELFSRRLHLAVPSVDTDLIETGLLDSAAFVDLLLALEQEFGIEVSLDDLDQFRSVQNIAGFIALRAPKPAVSEGEPPAAMKASGD